MAFESLLWPWIPTGAFFPGRNPCVRMCAAWLGDPLIPSINLALSLFHLLLIEFGIPILIHFPLIISGISKYNFQNSCFIYSSRQAAFFSFFTQQKCATTYFLLSFGQTQSLADWLKKTRIEVMCED